MLNRLPDEKDYYACMLRKDFSSVVVGVCPSSKTFPQPQRVVARIGEIKLTLAILLTVKLSLFLFLVSPTCRGFYDRSLKIDLHDFLIAADTHHRLDILSADSVEKRSTSPT